MPVFRVCFRGVGGREECEKVRAVGTPEGARELDINLFNLTTLVLIFSNYSVYVGGQSS